MKNLVLLSAFACLFILPFSAFSQKGTLRGVVFDAKTKETIIGANVIWLNDPSIGAATDYNGNYEISLPTGAQTVIVSFTGMQTDTLSAFIKENQIVKLDINMRIATKELGIVVISAGKFEQDYGEVTVSMEVIKPNIIENKNTKSIQTALEQAPGVVILDSEPQIRGGSGFNFGVGSRVGVYVDDLPVLVGDVGKPEWGFIPVENVEQIEIVKGASSVLYGSSALNGIINIRTAYPKINPVTNVNVFSGMYSTPQTREAKWWNGVANFSGANFFHSRKIGRLDFVIGGNALYDHNYIGPPPTHELLQPDPITNNQVAEKKGRMNFNLRYRPKIKNGLSYGLNGNFMLSQTNFSLVWLNTKQGIYSAYPGTMTLQNLTLFYLDPYIEYYNEKGFQHTLRTRINHANYANGNNQANRSTVYFGNYQFQRSYESLDGLTMTAGVMSSYTNSWSELYIGSGSQTNNAKNAAGFMQLDKKMWGVVNFSGGVRYEYFQINHTENVTKPVFRSGVSLKAGKETYFRTSYGQGYRFPTIAEKFISTSAGGLGVYPNDSLRPETSWNFEMGVKQGVKLGKFMGYLDISGFWQEYKDAVEYVFTQWSKDMVPPGYGYGFRFMNTSDIQVRGVDVSLMGRTELSKDCGINILAGYTYTTPRSLQPDKPFGVDSSGVAGKPLTYNNTSVDTTDQILKYRFRHIAKVDLEFFRKKFTIGYSWRYYSYMQNLDRTFYELDSTFLKTGLIAYRGDQLDLGDLNDPTDDRIIIGGKKRGNFVMDMRISYQISVNHKIALVSNNFLNREFSLRPLKIEAPRSISIQYTFRI